MRSVQTWLALHRILHIEGAQAYALPGYTWEEQHSKTIHKNVSMCDIEEDGLERPGIGYIEYPRETLSMISYG